jgi:multicomponent Na+:H+ antiporter subunit G
VDVIAVLLGVAVAAVLLTSCGVLLSRNVYQRLHYLAPASTIGVVCVAAAILIHDGFSQSGVKAVIAASILFVMNPILTHATARAARVNERGHWEPDPKP